MTRFLIFEERERLMTRAQEFYNIYKQAIEPIFQEFEPIRRKELQKVFAVITVVIILSIFAIIYAVISKVYPINIWFLSIFYGFIVFFCFMPAFVLWRNKVFQKKLKSKALPKLLKVFGDIFPVKGESYYTGKKYTACDDAFAGSYKDVSFRINEEKVYDESWLRCFNIVSSHRVIIKFKFNKSIKGHVEVVSKEDTTKGSFSGTVLFGVCAITAVLMGALVFRATGRLDFLLKPSVKMLVYIVSAIIFGIVGYFIKEKLRVKLEDVGFEKKYNTYSDDQVEARYILTPTFMERLKNIETVFGTSQLSCNVSGSLMTITIEPEKDLFEVGSLFTSLKDTKAIVNFYKELTSILDMVDTFKLDEKTHL